MKPWQSKSYIGMFAVLFGVSGVLLLSFGSAQQPTQVGSQQGSLGEVTSSRATDLIVVGVILALVAAVLAAVFLGHWLRQKNHAKKPGSLKK